MRNLSLQEIAKMIDHAALKPYQTDKEIINECKIALKYNTAAICIPPYAVRTCKEFLKNSSVKVCCVIGFPHGNTTTNIKVFEAIEAVANGATEIDMVINIGKFKSEDNIYTFNEISSIKNAIHDIPLKVIFENCYLSELEIKDLCEICSRLQVDFIKTSTGFGYIKNSLGIIEKKGADLEQVILMNRKTSYRGIKIKASGGIETLEDIEKFYKVGVTRFGTSFTEKIMQEVFKNQIEIKVKETNDVVKKDCVDCPTGVDCSSCSKRYNEEHASD